MLFFFSISLFVNTLLWSESWFPNSFPNLSSSWWDISASSFLAPEVLFPASTPCAEISSKLSEILSNSASLFLPGSSKLPASPTSYKLLLLALLKRESSTINFSFRSSPLSLWLSWLWSPTILLSLKSLLFGAAKKESSSEDGCSGACGRPWGCLESPTMISSIRPPFLTESKSSSSASIRLSRLSWSCSISGVWGLGFVAGGFERLNCCLFTPLSETILPLRMGTVSSWSIIPIPIFPPNPIPFESSDRRLCSGVWTVLFSFSEFNALDKGPSGSSWSLFGMAPCLSLSPQFSVPSFEEGGPFNLFSNMSKLSGPFPLCLVLCWLESLLIESSLFEMSLESSCMTKVSLSRSSKTWFFSKYPFNLWKTLLSVFLVNASTSLLSFSFIELNSVSKSSLIVFSPAFNLVTW